MTGPNLRPPTVTIGGRAISTQAPPFIVAELSANHNGDIERALRLIDEAKAAGADAIKLQTYTADTITIDHDGPDFRITGGLWDGRNLYDLYREAQTPWEWHEQLFSYGRSLGIMVFSSPFDATAVDLLERLGTPAYKIASFEAIDLPLIRRVAATKKPMIISTGIANLGEIHDAVVAARGGGCEELALLHCVSAYPAPAEEMNLRTIPHLADTFNVVAGLSDHTMGTAVAAASVALGASIIEKHLTLARSDGGPDSAFSLEPHELRELVNACRATHAALGQISYERLASEERTAMHRRSLYAVADISVGEALTPANIRSIRPGYGLAPRHYDDLIGRKARRFIARGTPLAWNLFE
jgi:N-acetylneuraminate synthase